MKYNINVREYRRANEKSGETGNTGHTRRRKAKQNYNTICLGYHYTQTNTNNIIKTCDLLQATGGKDEPNIVLCGNRYGHHNALRPTIHTRE